MKIQKLEANATKRDFTMNRIAQDLNELQKVATDYKNCSSPEICEAYRELMRGYASGIKMQLDLVLCLNMEDALDNLVNS